MKRLWKIEILAVMLLVSSVFAGFIQSPIPPSSRDNFMRDMDGDGRLDRIDIKFLGVITNEYLDQMVDSLTFDWLNVDGLVSHYRVNRKSFILDSSFTRRVLVDLKSRQKDFKILTALSVDSLPKGALGNVHLFLRDGSVYDVNVKDQMAPVISEGFLKSSRGQGSDSLTLMFSESISGISGCDVMLESKVHGDTVSRFWATSDIEWNENHNAAVFVFDGTSSDKRLLPGDSIRLTPKCARDSARNIVADNAGFAEMTGFYPLEVLMSKMVRVETSVSDNLPIFQMRFEDLPSEMPDEENWGIAIDVLGPEFENAVRDILGLSQKTVLDLSKLSIRLSLRIYTNLGSFVVGTSDEIFGDDSRFEGGAKRLFLKWNLMDGMRKHVATGAYISNAAVIISYDGQVVFRNDYHHGPTTQIFGVKRR